MGVAVALIASAVIGAGTAAYTSSQQKKATKQASSRAEDLERKRQADEKLIRDASSTPESATVDFGTDENEDDTVGSFGEFIAPKRTTTGLGTTGGTSSGLGFSV